MTKENGKLTLRPTKTSKGRRTTTFAQDALDVLAAHRARQSKERALLDEGWGQPGHLFTTTSGTFLDYGNVLRARHKLKEAAGVPKIGLHDARHLLCPFLFAIASTCRPS